MFQWFEKHISRKQIQAVLVLLVFAVGLAIRLYDLTDPPMDFHPARQYHSAVIARGLYTRWGGAYPERLAQLNIAQEVSEVRIEPPLLEHLVGFTYRITGTDALWFARVYSILFWIAGGFPLYYLLRKWSGFGGALVALGAYLLIPFGVVASRAFQPDPLMVSLVLYSLWGLNRWVEKPSWRRAVTAGLLMGAALLVKQVAVFFLGAGAAGMLILSWGLRKSLRSGQVWLVGGLALLPVLLYNLYGVLIDGSLAGQYSQRFFPELWTEPAFYLGWSGMIDQTVGLVVFLTACLGFFLLREKAVRGLIFGYLAGYLVYGFVFAHHISTHDYYQLPILPLAALGLGLVADRLFFEVSKTSGKLWGRLGITVLMLMAALFCLWEARSSMKKMDYRDQPVLLAQLSESMGGPETPAAGLMEDYGAAFYYYGYILPAYWWPDEQGRAVSGMSSEELEALLLVRTDGKDFFIISDMDALAAQPRLAELLQSKFAIFFADAHYLVYDLRTED